MEMATVTRRTILRTAALGATALAMPFVRGSRAAGNVVPSGKMVLAWHTNIASRWLDPQQHDGTASPDNFIFTLHDALIKNFREVRYDHPALAEGFEFAETPRALRSSCGPASHFMTAPQSRRLTSNGATSTTAAPGATFSTRTPMPSKSSATTLCNFTSRSRSSISRSCSAPAMSAALAGLCLRSTTNRLARRVFCRSQSVLARTGSCRRSPV